MNKTNTKLTKKTSLPISEIKITNSMLAEKTGLPLSKIRRNSKELLPPDPRAGRRSGFTREMTIEEAWRVYLGSILVSEHALSFVDARRAIEVLWPFLKKYNLVPNKGNRNAYKRYYEGLDNSEDVKKYYDSFEDYEISFSYDTNRIIKSSFFVRFTVRPNTVKKIKDKKHGHCFQTEEIIKKFIYNDKLENHVNYYPERFIPIRNILLKFEELLES